MAPQINSIPPSLRPQDDLNYLSQNNAAGILALVGTLGFLAVVVVAMRLYVRISILKSVGVDDYLMTAAMTLGMAMFICFVGETYNGLGHHYETIRLPEQERYLRWLFAHSLCATTALCLVKISIAFFLMRLAARRSWQWFLWIVIVFLICYTIASLGTLIFACVPVQASWDLKLIKTAKCFSPSTFISIGLWNAVTGVVTDFLLATIPIPIVMHLNFNWRTKGTLAVVMSLGYVACAVAVAKTYFLVRFTVEKDRTFHDWFVVLAGVELYLGILSASLPSLKRLFIRFLNTTRAMLSSSRRSRSQGPCVHGKINSGYQRQHDLGHHLEMKPFEQTTISPTTIKSASRGHEPDTGVQRPCNARVNSGNNNLDFEFDLPQTCQYEDGRNKSATSWYEDETTSWYEEIRPSHPSGIVRITEVGRSEDTAHRGGTR